MYRNLDARVAVGIQDELEVQEMMSRAFPDYGPPDLGATFSHIKYEKQEWKDSGIDLSIWRKWSRLGLRKSTSDDLNSCFPVSKSKFVNCSVRNCRDAWENRFRRYLDER